MKNLTTIQATIVIAAALVSTAVEAHGEHITANAIASSLVTEIVYDSPAHNRGIHGYPNPLAPVVIDEKSWIYIDKAHGQAVYSYPGVTK
jgi:hypothetical protein